MQKHNLNLGRNSSTNPNKKGLQDPSMKGNIYNNGNGQEINGAINMCNNGNNKSYLGELKKYKNKLIKMGTPVKEVRLMTIEETKKLGCTYQNERNDEKKLYSHQDCSKAPVWVRTSTYWTQTEASYGPNNYYYIKSPDGRFMNIAHCTEGESRGIGLRPVIVLENKYIK